jgi:hypothetical protein
MTAAPRVLRIFLADVLGVKPVLMVRWRSNVILLGPEEELKTNVFLVS